MGNRNYTEIDLQRNYGNFVYGLWIPFNKAKDWVKAKIREAIEIGAREGTVDNGDEYWKWICR
jgi:hypothetical protein